MASGGLRGYDCQEVSGAEDGDIAIAPNGQKVLISGDQITGFSGRGASQQIVIVGVTTHTGRRSMGKEEGIQAKEPEERLSIPRINAVLRLDLKTVQDLRHLVGLPRNQEKQECAPAPCVDQVALDALGAEEAA